MGAIKGLVSRSQIRDESVRWIGIVQWRILSSSSLVHARAVVLLRESTVASAVHNKLTNLRVTSHPHLVQRDARARARDHAWDGCAHSFYICPWIISYIKQIGRWIVAVADISAPQQHWPSWFNRVLFARHEGEAVMLLSWIYTCVSLCIVHSWTKIASGMESRDKNTLLILTRLANMYIYLDEWIFQKEKDWLVWVNWSFKRII